MKAPLISVIIPAFNSEKIIERCIQSLLSQSFPREKFEIIVVDDGSTDKTAEIAKNVGADLTISTKNEGIWNARRVGVLAAKGMFIASIDADCSVFDGWLDTIAKELEKNYAITGPLLNGNNHSMISWAEYFMEFSHFNEFRKRSAAEYLIGANHAIIKKIYPITEIPNSKNAPEDVIRSELVKKTGTELIFVPEMKVKHYGRTDLAGCLLNMYQVGNRVCKLSKEMPNIYTKFNKTKLTLPLVFGIRFGARMRSAIHAKKFFLFLLASPFIILGTVKFCKGFSQAIK